MLRLEKLRGHDLSISLRSKNRFLNKDFWRAFLIAGAIHLSGLIFFRIGFLFVPEVGTLPSVEVKIEMKEGVEVLIPSKNDFIFSWLQPIHTSLNEFKKEEVKIENYFNPLNRKEFFHLHLCGMLADLEVEIDPLILNELHVDSFQRMIFQVEIEGKSGKIFWIEPKETYLSSNMKESMNEIFSKMQFKKTFEGIIYSGDIEVSLYPFSSNLRLLND